VTGYPPPAVQWHRQVAATHHLLYSGTDSSYTHHRLYSGTNR
jgi:hypothetical protein